MEFRYLVASSVFILFISCLLPGRVFSGDTVSSVINGIGNRYGEMEGLTVRYSREAISKSMSMLEPSERHDLASGRIYFRPPHYLRLDQSSPREELLVTDGKTLWWHIPSKNQAFKYDAGDFGRELRLLSDVFTGLKDAKEKFEITLGDASEPNIRRLVLRPETPWEDIDHLEILVHEENFALTQVDILNEIGGVTRFRFDKWRQKHLEISFFSFSPPADMELIEK